jgi:hypothetical protein
MPSYNKDAGAAKGNRGAAQAKVLKHMGGRGVGMSKTDKGIKGLGNPSAEGKYI